MADGTSNYFYRRAENELEMAQRALHPDAVRAHYLLAGFYLDRVYNAAGNSEPVQPKAPIAAS